MTTHTHNNNAVRRAPLRAIVRRLDRDGRAIDVLECGHTVVGARYDHQKARRCVECDDDGRFLRPAHRIERHVLRAVYARPSSARQIAVALSEPEQTAAEAVRRLEGRDLLFPLGRRREIVRPGQRAIVWSVTNAGAERALAESKGG